MRIRCNERFRPYSHTPGTYVVLPGTSWRFQCYPALIRIDDLSTPHPKLLHEVNIKVSGPLKEFTVQLDLERECIVIWGADRKGYFRYRIESCGSAWGIVLEKAPIEDFIPSQYCISAAKQTESNKERLFLGCLKAQDWDLVRRRGSMAEILPFWYRLGKTFDVPIKASGGTYDLLDNTLEAVFQCWKAGFEGILSPRLFDSDHQGIVGKKEPEGSPLALLQKGAKLIRSFFIEHEDSHLFLLPKLPTEFHCGKFIHLNVGPHELDLEWTKKSLRRIVIRAGKSENLELVLPKKIRRFRVDQVRKASAGESLLVESGQTYFLDRFEK